VRGHAQTLKSENIISTVHYFVGHRSPDTGQRTRQIFCILSNAVLHSIGQIIMKKFVK